MRFREPEPSTVGETYWRYCARGILPAQRCLECGRLRMYLRRTCSACFSLESEWVELSGLGRVYASTTCMYPLSDEYTAPYVVALIDLDEGLRMMSNVVGTADETAPIGMRVKVVFERVSDSISIPLFTPVSR